ncbi:MAG: hypothetical protein ABI586_05315 [Candidatus Nanopelagicales bacterium]
MRSVRGKFVVAMASTLMLSALPLVVSPASAGTKTWHILHADKVENSRITYDIAHAVDSAIASIAYSKGGEANFEHCGFTRTEHISVARNTRWEAGARHGITLIMQFRRVAAAKGVFQRAKNHYLACTRGNFGYKYPTRVSVKGAYIKKQKQLRLQWAIYDDATHTSTLKANGIALKREGAALIITRSTTQNLSTITQSTNSKLTARQGARYKAVAFT